MDANYIHLLRHSNSQFGKFGVLFDYLGLPFNVTLENHEKAIPVTPENGFWKCIPAMFHGDAKYQGKGYPTFEIIVPGRTEVKFHKLNFDYQSEGCVGLGEAYQIIDGKPAIAESDRGFTEFWTRYSQFPELWLSIEEHIIQPYVKR